MTDLFLKLINMSVSAGWIVLAILLVRVVFRKVPKWINVAIWSLVGVRLFLPFSIKSILSLIPITNTIPKEITVSSEPAIQSGIEAVDSSLNPVIRENFAPVVSDSVNPMQIIISVAVAVWIIGIIAMLTYMAVSYLKLYFRIREGAPDTDNTIICDRINTPFIMGVIKPKIYLPSNLDDRYKQYVIAHENAHIKRHDYLWKLLAFIFLTVYWFNPLMWVAYILLCRDIEFACDEKVIRQQGEEYKAPYSEALLNCSVKKKAVNINPIAFGEVSVKDRIKNIFNYKKPPLWITVIAIVLSCCLMVGFLTDPVDKNKTDKKPDTIETVTSENDDTTSDLTESVVSGTEESKPAESKPQDTKEPDKIIDNTDKLSLAEINQIKKAYLKYTGIVKGLDEISFKYYTTLSDGSMVIHIDQRENDSVVTDEIANEYLYTYNYGYSLMIYKNNQFEKLKYAYDSGLISKAVLDELFKKYPHLNSANKKKESTKEYTKTELEIINLYLKEMKGKTVNTDDVGLSNYKTYNDGSVGVELTCIKHPNFGDDFDTVIAGHKYKYSIGYYEYRIYKNGKLYSFVDAYKNGVISKKIVDEFFESKQKFNTSVQLNGLSETDARKIINDYIDGYEQDFCEVILKYKLTLSDSSKVIWISETGVNYAAVMVEDYIAEQYLYEYSSGYGLTIYKNGKFSSIKNAYDTGLISKAVLDELFKKMPALNKLNNYITEDDYLGNMNLNIAVGVKETYKIAVLRLAGDEYLKTDYKDMIMTNCGTLSDGSIILNFKLRKPFKNESVINEEIAGYEYEYVHSNRTLIYKKDIGLITKMELFYERGDISKELIGEFLAKLPEIE